MRSSWTYLVCVMLAMWLVVSPITMGYPSYPLYLSDLISSAAIFFIALAYWILKKDGLKWIMACVGTWLTLAPLVFWSPDPGSYANNTLVGALIIICSIVIPTIVEEPGPHDSGIPPLWSYNPSSWNQRFPIIFLAFTGFLMARYLSAFQLGHMKEVWDPVFGNGTANVLTSDVSKWFPISDAGLGAWSYLLDALSGAIGGTRRWRTMPWVVIMFGIMVIPPGITSITLVILQPLAVGSWCFICLVASIVMLLMVPPAIDEVVATIQALMAAKRQNRSLWKMFWFGIPLVATNAVEKPESLMPTIPTHLFICTFLGTWVMLAPTLFSTTGLASDGLHIMGALIVTFAIIAMAQVARPTRFVVTLFGGILAISIWFLPGGNLFYQVQGAVIGLFLIYFSMGRGPIEDTFGSYDRVVRWEPFKKQPPIKPKPVTRFKQLFARH